MRLHIIFIITIITFLGCDTKQELTKQVKDSITKELPNENLKNFGLETKIINLDLIEKGKNEYVGILTTNEIRRKNSKYYNKKDTSDNNFQFEYDVHVISDGDKFMYEIQSKRLK
jgi:hypothetical protein